MLSCGAPLALIVLRRAAGADGLALRDLAGKWNLISRDPADSMAGRGAPILILTSFPRLAIAWPPPPHFPCAMDSSAYYAPELPCFPRPGSLTHFTTAFMTPTANSHCAVPAERD